MVARATFLRYTKTTVIFAYNKIEVARAIFFKYAKIMEYCLSVKFYNDNYGVLSLRVKRSNPQPLIIYLFTKKKKNSLLTINIKIEKKKFINRIIMPYTEIATNLQFSQWQCGLSTLVSHTEIATGLRPSQWRAWNKRDCHRPLAFAMTVWVEYPGVPYWDCHRPSAFAMRSFGCV